jgi:hypothetical protein
LGDQIAGLQLDSAGGNFGDGGADSFSSVNGEINSALLISFFSDGSVQLIPMTPSQLSSLFSATAQHQINVLTVKQVGNIIFNETQSLTNSGKENVSLDQARETIEHTIINTDVKYGAERDKIAGTAPSTVSERAIKGNPAAYKSSQEAARQAYAESKRGVDPTRGSIRFNLRANTSRVNFQKIQPIKTQSGPYNNSYPSEGLPSSGVYVNTYGPPN